MAVMTEAKLRKIVREELKRRIRESYDPFYDTEMGSDREWVGTPGEEWYDTTLGDDEEWVEDTEEDLSDVRWWRRSGVGADRSVRWRPTEQGWRSEKGDKLVPYSEMPAPRPTSRLREAAYRAALRRLRYNR